MFDTLDAYEHLIQLLKLLAYLWPGEGSEANLDTVYSILIIY